MNKYIYVETQFAGIHQWTGAPNFLSHPHRHLFKVILSIQVRHNNRQVEFFELQEELNQFISERFKKGLIYGYSCEDIAEIIFKEFNDRNYTVFKVTVSEDDENGAEIVSNTI